MTQATAVLSVIRLTKPAFRSNEDKLAFAVHAYIITQGYKLVATGAEAEAQDADFAADREEVGSSGWDSLPEFFSFRYQDAEGKRPSLYMKCIVAGPKLLIQFMQAASTNAPKVVELETSKYTTSESTVPAAYQNTDELMKLLDSSLGTTFVASAASPAAAAERRLQEDQQQQPGPSQYYHPEREEGYRSPLQEGPPRYPSREPMPPGILPTGVGYEDVVPPGVRPPGYGGIGGGLEGPMHGAPHLGGGMHVGPGHPMFGPGRYGEGVRPLQPPGGGGSGGSSLPPGARWDPIGPPGTRGFRPDDFQRGDPSKPHPDMMQPGPGKGSDWDSMFG